MRSSEIAELAGVTVRTLRHYHALGLLPEPARGENGYRHYEVEDLVRVLRIKRLAILGFSLEQIGSMLGDEADDESATEALNRLDHELQEHIAQLEAQRAMIAKLQAQGVHAQVPPDFAPFIGMVAERTRNRELVALETDAALLADSLMPPAVVRFLHALHRELVGQGAIDDYVALSERFMALDGSSTAEERGALAQCFADLLSPLLQEIAEIPALAHLDCRQEVLGVMVAFDNMTSNAVQQEVSETIAELIEQRWRREGRFSEVLVSCSGAVLDPDVTS